MKSGIKHRLYKTDVNKTCVPNHPSRAQKNFIAVYALYLWFGRTGQTDSMSKTDERKRTTLYSFSDTNYAGRNNTLMRNFDYS